MHKSKNRSGADDAPAGKSSSVNMLGYVLGQVCSLRCKHCCEKTPYFPSESKTQVPAETVINDIRHMAQACEFITILEYIGGEPFLHNGLPAILRDALDLQNVGFVNVFTNGTILPSDELCDVLGDKRISVYISNYTKSLSLEHKRKVDATESKLAGCKAHYLFGTAKRWFDFASFDYTDLSRDETRSHFLNCFIHTCKRLHNGVLYHCAHHYAGEVLGKIPAGKDSVRIHEYETDSLSAKLEEFCKTDSIEACKYCALPFDAPLVTAGIQLDGLSGLDGQETTEAAGIC